MHDPKKHIDLAENLVLRTYKLTGSPKILKIAMNNLYTGLKFLMKEATKSETEDFLELVDLSEKEFKKKGINKNFITFLRDIHSLKMHQKESNIEFSRKDKYIFASESYDLEVLSEKEVKDYILKAKLLLNLVI